MFTTALVQTPLVVSALASPPGSPVAGVQALLVRLIATLAALWAWAPTLPLRRLLECSLRLTRPLLLDPQTLAPCSTRLEPTELFQQLVHLHQALTWEARGLPGWPALEAALLTLLAMLGAELGARRAA